MFKRIIKRMKMPVGNYWTIKQHSDRIDKLEQEFCKRTRIYHGCSGHLIDDAVEAILTYLDLTLEEQPVCTAKKREEK